MLFYRLSIYVYYLFIRFASLFNTKAKRWVDGRKNQGKLFENKLPNQKRVWFHFASLGEFEQGRSLIHFFEKNKSEYSIVITFFSPSGYEQRKNYPCEGVYYLPLDTPNNAKKFIDFINPSIAIFNKYEYWHYTMKELHISEIPLFVTSAIFRENQIFFQWYGWFYRKTLGYVTHFFTQNQKSDSLLESIDHENYTMAGDTRFDRVFEHSLSVKDNEKISQFVANKKSFVGGSTWLPDEEIILPLIEDLSDYKFILVPHEINTEKIQTLKNKIGSSAFLYSEFDTKYSSDKRVLIVDTIGLLSSIYNCSSISYIGGGFGKGIHNTLEAATFGKPIIFGPNYHKFQEAIDLIERKAAYTVNNANELQDIALKLSNDELFYNTAGTAAREYVLEKKGATEIITNYLQTCKYI